MSRAARASVASSSWVARARSLSKWPLQPLSLHLKKPVPRQECFDICSGAVSPLLIVESLEVARQEDRCRCHFRRSFRQCYSFYFFFSHTSRYSPWTPPATSKLPSPKRQSELASLPRRLAYRRMSTTRTGNTRRRFDQEILRQAQLSCRTLTPLHVLG